jgi:hypothetical protein
MIRVMDASGARHLAARIRAGVRVGQWVELVGDASTEGLHPGDKGVVHAISADGSVTVAWERGFSLAIDPMATPIRPAA